MTKKICVVVGAGPGVGLAVAKRFGQEGYQLALVARNEQALAKYVTELSGVEAHGFAADASNTDSIKAAFGQIKEQLGDPSVLVYNAAVLNQGLPSQLGVDQLIDEFKVNVAGALACAQQVIPAMRTQKEGTILFTGGGLALNPYPQFASLSIGKAGIRSLAYTLGAELEPEGIQVATVMISGIVRPGGRYSPEKIAEFFWQLHTQPVGKREREIIYK